MTRTEKDRDPGRRGSPAESAPCALPPNPRRAAAPDRPESISGDAFARAKELFPGGVNSPVRAFRSVGGTPVFAGRGKGPHLWDIEGTRYLDYCQSWGALILGHCNPSTVKAVRRQAGRGTSFGMPTRGETALAEMIAARVPGLEKLRFVSSGTEAAMSAIRLARGYTGRDLTVKFDGCYHGHSDSLLVNAGSGLADALGGHALGGHALGGHALAGHVLGGHVLGGHALGADALGADALGADALGADALGAVQAGEGTADEGRPGRGARPPEANTLSAGASAEAPAGVPAGIAAQTVSLPYNDSEIFTRFMDACGHRVAAVIVEPAAANMGLVLPAEGFLETLRARCDGVGTLLIFDEVVTGFRIAPGGAREYFGVVPDLACYGKVIGGGLPVGAFGGGSALMDCLVPAGAVYQAGTLSGNPLAMSAGAAALSRLEEGCYRRLEELGARLQGGIETTLNRCGWSMSRLGGMFSLFPGPEAPRGFGEAREGDATAFARVYNRLLANRIYLAPSAYEINFISLAHQARHIDRTIEAIRKSFREAA